MCEDEAALRRIPRQQFNFKKLQHLPTLPAHTFVDVVGVVKHIGDINTVVARATQKELRKRDVHLVDDSGAQVAVTIWGEEVRFFLIESAWPCVCLPEI